MLHSSQSKMRSTHRKKVRITKAKNNNVNMNNVKFLLCRNSRSLKHCSHDTINKGPYKKTERAFRETSSPIMSLKERGRTTCCRKC
jgi:hypothetical protein